MFLCRMYTEEGREHFTVRDNVLGHSQQGGTPTTFDRNMSTKLAARTVHWLTEQLNHLASHDGKDRERLLETMITPVKEQFTQRRPAVPWCWDSRGRSTPSSRSRTWSTTPTSTRGEAFSITSFFSFS